MTINRDLVVQAFPNQPRMQMAVEGLFSDVDVAVSRLNDALKSLTDLSGDSDALAQQLAAKQAKSDTLSAISALPADPGAIEQLGAGQLAIRPIDAADTKSLLTRQLADTRYLGGAHAAASATKLATARTIGMTGDVAWSSPAFDGSANVTAAGTIQANVVGFSKIVAATQKALIGANAAGNFQEITLGSGLTLSAGVLTATGSGGTVTSVTGTAPIVSSGGTTPAISITAATGAAAGSMSAADKTKLDAITGTNTGDQTITLTGDVTGSGSGSFAATLATVNANTGSWGSATQVAQITLDAKGRATAAANVTITPAVGSITGLGTGVATALAVNVGSAGAFVTFNGALGTPSSGTLTNCTFPTLNQNTTGSAAKLTTARTIGISGAVTGTATSFDGSGNITIPITAMDMGSATAGTLAVARGGTGDTGSAWTSYTPATIAPGSGSFTTASATGRYKQIGKMVFFHCALTITTNGTAAGWIDISLPVDVVHSVAYAMSFLGKNNTGAGANFGVATLGVAAIYDKVRMQNFDGTYPGATGAILSFSGCYESN